MKQPPNKTILLGDIVEMGTTEMPLGYYRLRNQDPAPSQYVVRLKGHVKKLRVYRHRDGMLSTRHGWLSPVAAAKLQEGNNG